jgi:hypothetical protein
MESGDVHGTFNSVRVACIACRSSGANLLVFADEHGLYKGSQEHKGKGRCNGQSHGNVLLSTTPPDD